MGQLTPTALFMHGCAKGGRISILPVRNTSVLGLRTWKYQHRFAIRYARRVNHARRHRVKAPKHESITPFCSISLPSSRHGNIFFRGRLYGLARSGKIAKSGVCFSCNLRVNPSHKRPGKFGYWYFCCAVPYHAWCDRIKSIFATFSVLWIGKIMHMCRLNLDLYNGCVLDEVA